MNREIKLRRTTVKFIPSDETVQLDFSSFRLPDRELPAALFGDSQLEALPRDF